MLRYEVFLNALRVLVTLLAASGFALVGCGCTRTEVTGTWQAIRNNPACGWEPAGASEELTFRPDGTYQRYFESFGSGRSSREEGRWSSSWLLPALEVDVNKTETLVGSHNGRVVTRFDYSVVGNQLWLTRKRVEFYGMSDFAQVQAFSDAPACAYRRVAGLVR